MPPWRIFAQFMGKAGSTTRGKDGNLHIGVQPIEIVSDEPLFRECEHFLESMRTRRKPLTDGARGADVLRVLQACQISLQLNGRPVVLDE